MVTIKAIDRNGESHAIDVTAGKSLMEELVRADMDVAAICGGCCSCGTCHVYVDPARLGELEPRSEIEADLIEGLIASKENSRLSCQIRITPELEGLVVELAPE